MATGSHSTAHGVDGAPVFAEQKAAEVILRPVVRPETSEGYSGSPSRLSGRGSAGVAAADFCFPERGYSEGFGAGREQVFLQDGLGAMRGLMFMLGLYMVMAVMGLGGLLLWHWLR